LNQDSGAPARRVTSSGRESTVLWNLRTDRLQENAVAAAPGQSDLELRGVSKHFGSYQALDDVSFTVDRGEFVAIMGPSGCGKTTLLRTIAGLETPDGGTIRSRGRDLESLPVHKRGTRLVWQSYALFPHLDVRRNIEFGLTFQKLDAQTIKGKVAAIAGMVQLTDFLDRRVTKLSGGQRQRVAIARALVTEPDLLLLDEPLSALDPHLRVRMQGEMKRLQQRLGISFIYVTHNQSEAFSMADRIVVMDKGHVDQIGTPKQLCLWPKTRFTAQFVGTNNIIDGNVLELNGDIATIECPAGRLYATLSETTVTRGSWPAPRSTVTLVIQASKVRRQPNGAPYENRVSGVLTDKDFNGTQVTYFVRLPDGSEMRAIVADPFSQAPISLGTILDLYWSPEDSVVLGASVVPSAENMPGAKTYVRLGG
jgi:spermidine/putrescine transport system ATP-binding protein